MVGKDVVSTVAVANVSAGAEAVKLAPLAAAFTVGGLTPYDWAFTLAAMYSAILIVHFVGSKWLLPLWRFMRGKRAERSAAEVGK